MVGKHVKHGFGMAAGVVGLRSCTSKHCFDAVWQLGIGEVGSCVDRFGVEGKVVSPGVNLLWFPVEKTLGFGLEVDAMRHTERIHERDVGECGQSILTPE